MNHELASRINTLVAHGPDLSSGSSDIYFLGDEVIKVLKPIAGLFQFCADCSANEVLTFAQDIEQLMEQAFGEAIVSTTYYILNDKLITVQPKIIGKTLKELNTDENNSNPNLESITQGIARLRTNWQGDAELLGYIIGEILDPSNILFDGEKLLIVDWL